MTIKVHFMRLQNILFPIILLALTIIVFVKYRKLSRPKSFTELDHLDSMLVDVKKKLPPNATIGFASNTPTGRSGVLYFKSAISLAPIVVENAESDTTLVIGEPQYASFPSDKYECILNGGNGYLNYSLLRLKP